MFKTLHLTAGHTPLPGSSVAYVSSFSYLLQNTTSKRPETATAYTGKRCAPF